MPNISGISTNLVLTTKENWQTTLNGGINDSVTTVTVDDNTDYTVGKWVIWTIDQVDASTGAKTPDKKEVIYGQVGASNTLINVVRGVEGTAQSHASGAIVRDITTSAHWNIIAKMLEVAHNANGSIKNGAISSADQIADGTITKVKLAADAKIGVRTYSIASTATLTPTVDNYDMFAVTAQAATLTIAAPTGTPVDGQGMLIRYKDNGTARTLTWNAIYRAIGITIPVASVASKTGYVALRYNAADTKWDVISVGREA